jgi:hypothetical protein
VGSRTRAPKPAPSSATRLAHSLGLEVVAEGIEDQPALETVRDHGCDSVQGYHLARPMSADPFAALLRWSQLGLPCWSRRLRRRSQHLLLLAVDDRQQPLIALDFEHQFGYREGVGSG